VGATRDDFARAGRDLPGARRPVLLKLTDCAFSEESAQDPVQSEPSQGSEPPTMGSGGQSPPSPTRRMRAVRLKFTLPAGGYATVVVASVTSPTA
jgi:tRNA(Glu) U13 pseudouridine synthase TruD